MTNSFRMCRYFFVRAGRAYFCLKIVAHVWTAKRTKLHYSSKFLVVVFIVVIIIMTSYLSPYYNDWFNASFVATCQGDTTASTSSATGDNDWFNASFVAACQGDTAASISSATGDTRDLGHLKTAHPTKYKRQRILEPNNETGKIISLKHDFNVQCIAVLKSCYGGNNDRKNSNTRTLLSPLRSPSSKNAAVSTAPSPPTDSSFEGRKRQRIGTKTDITYTSTNMPMTNMSTTNIAAKVAVTRELNENDKTIDLHPWWCYDHETVRAKVRQERQRQGTPDPRASWINTVVPSVGTHIKKLRNVFKSTSDSAAITTTTATTTATATVTAAATTTTTATANTDVTAEQVGKTMTQSELEQLPPEDRIEMDSVVVELDRKQRAATLH